MCLAGAVSAAPAQGSEQFEFDEKLSQAILRRVPKRPVQISAHRGASRYAPENTLPAFEKAIRLGADYVEFDVRTTSDGEFFLLHDSRLDRTTDGTGLISQKSAAEVRKLSAGIKFSPDYASVRVPSLDEFLDRFSSTVNLYFDAKAIPPESLAKVLERHHAVERTVVYQSVEYLRKLKNVGPRIRRLAPLSKQEDLPNVISAVQPYAVDADWNILSKGLITRCHAAGVKVFSDALGEHETTKDYLQAIEWSIDLIQTDYPVRVLTAIEQRQKRP